MGPPWLPNPSAVIDPVRSSSALFFPLGRPETATQLSLAGLRLRSAVDSGNKFIN